MSINQTTRESKDSDFKPYTTHQEKIGESFTEVLIIAKSMKDAKIVQSVTGSPKIDGWVLCETIGQNRETIERYPLINNAY